MDIELLKTVGQVAGIGGIALGVFLLLFRDIINKNFFTQLTKTQSYNLFKLISILVWSIALAGIIAWVWTSVSPGKTTSQEVSNGSQGYIHTGQGDINAEKIDQK
ncbi:MAG: hypothetical protein C4531_08970 [Desulfurivibrio sp.]|jgi:hypothetical protein|nr:MAG: hypothetical protein C4531_08970 [Desulfurivibrio sp.]